MDALYLYTDPTRPEGNELLISRHYDAVYSDSVVERPGLAACLLDLRQGDTLHVASLAHFARDTAGCVQVLGRLARQGVDVCVDNRGVTCRARTRHFWLWVLRR